MRISACVLALLVATIPAAVVALGLGNVEVGTTLNEPLRAKIPLTRVAAGEVDAIDVRLGTQEQFERAGLERPFYLSQLKFKVVPDGGGAHVEVTTQNPVTEPFLNFLVEVNWPSGRMIREYTLLLDPPVYGAAITTATKSSVATVETLPEPGQMPSMTRVTAPEPASAPSSMGTSASMVAPPDMAGVDSYGPVVAQETLWSIATRVRPDESVSVQRMMLAILEANPEAFLINNINALKKGAVLRIPDRSEIGADDKSAAMAEVRRQQALWDEYRSQLAGAPAPMPEGAAAPSTGTGAAGTGQTSVTGEDTSRLELLASGQAEGAGAPGDTASVEAMRERLNLALEEADSKQRENQELSERLAETEQLISDLNRMLELKDDEIAQLQESLRTQGAAAPETQPQPMPEPEPMPTPEPEAAQPEPEPAPAPKPAPEPEPAPKPAPPPPPPPKPTSFVDDILNTVRGFLPKDIFGFDPILVVGGGLGLLLILGGAGALVRRRKAAEEDVEILDIGEGESMIERYAAGEDDGVTEMPEGPAPDEDATMLAGSDEVTERPDAGGETVAESDEDDPLGELNVYMAYEHFDQAEDLVRGAIAAYPDRHEYRLKLLGVFAAAKDLPSFQEAARELRDQVGEDSPLMASAAELWNGIAPGRDMFAGPQDAETAVDAESDDVFDVTSGDAEDADASVDFDLGFELTEGEEGDAESGDSGVDFDLDAGDEAPAEEAAAEESDEIDFDLGETTDGAADEGLDETVGTSDLDFDLGSETTDESTGEDDELDFDLSGDEGGEVAEESGEAEDEGLDFDLSGGADEAEEPAEAGDAEAAADEGLDETVGTSDLDFDLGSEKTDESAGDEEELDFDIGGDEPEAEAAESSDDSGLDFDIGGDEPEAEAAESSDDSGLDFDIGGDEPEAEAAESSDDSGLDFDIGGDEPEAEAAESSDDSGLDFDIGGDEPEAEAAESGDDSGLDFDIGGDEPEAAESSDDSGLDFDIGGDEPEAEAAESGDDAELDFDIGGDDAESASAEKSQPGIDTVHLGQQKVDEIESASEESGDDSGLDFDIGGGEEADDPDVGIDTQFTDVFADSDEGGDDLILDQDAGLDHGAEDETASPAAEEDAGTSEDSGLDLDLGSGDAPEAGADDEEGFEATQFMLRDVEKPDEEASDDDDDDKTIALKRTSGEVDDIQTKLDLAEAYIEMGDKDGARGILSEVMNEGSDEQKEQANNLLSKLD